MRGEVQHDIVAAARALAPDIRDARDNLDSGRRLPPALAQALDEAGMFKTFLPRSMGGPEVDPITAFHAIEELARADGSVGWCAAISGASSWFAGSLRKDAGQSLFGLPPVHRGAGSFRALGEARPVDGGYQVRGRWDFASGVDHANILFFNCNVVDDNGPRLSPAGTPETLMMIAPVEIATIYDTWQVVGLCGTGSNDFVIEDGFVPKEQTFKLFDPPLETGPLYVSRFFFVAAWTPIVATALGMARGAMDTFLEMTTQLGTTTSTTLLQDRPQVQSTVGKAEAIISAARAYVLDAVSTAWQAICDCLPDPSSELAKARLAITHGCWEAIQAVDLLFHGAGTNAIHRKYPLERFFRDIHAIVQHGAGLPSNFESGGKVLLGLRPSDPGW